MDTAGLTSICFPSFVVALLNDPHHRFFERLPLQEQTVFVPDEVDSAKIESMSLHTALEQRQYIAIVRFRRERESSTVAHELFELGGLVQAELVDSHLFLFALDVVILLVLGAAGQTLPWQ